ncbi:MAG TPA: ATP-binding protein [Candidatus Binatia bacterium]|nr:ATP-binding protein [Candidatus Binatia bacterium]
MSFSNSSRMARYTYAALAVAAVLLARLTVRHEITDTLNSYPFLLFHIPVLFSAWFFGRGAGIVATLLSAASVLYFLLPPLHVFNVSHLREFFPTAIFIAEGVVISFFAAAKREAEKKLEQGVRERTRELEEALTELTQKEDLAALGTAISKIAHEIANRVNGLSTAVQMLEKNKAGQSDSQVDAILQGLKDEIDRLSGFIRDLRQASRPLPFHLAPMNVSDALAELKRFHAVEIDRALEIVEDLPADLPPVMADQDKLQDALLNLWKNALEAMPNGGKIILKAYEENGNVCIEIQDTGVGIPKDINIFDLFTTTKERGWGLGLPMARQTILAHQGTISYTSQPGEGTTFKISLPIAKGIKPRAAA